MLTFSAVALLPDLDFVTMEMGFRGTPLDHRAMTHSLAFCVVAGALLGRLARAEHRVFVSMLAVLALASHAMLDAMSQSDPGPQILWPFSTSPIVALWRPIPGTDSYLQYFTPAALPTFGTELVLSLPLIAVTAWILCRRSALDRQPKDLATVRSED